MDASKFRSLSPAEQALVAIAVLLDGREAGVYLEYDARNGPGLRDSAYELAESDPELRMAYISTMLRRALGEIGKN